MPKAKNRPNSTTSPACHARRGANDGCHPRPRSTHSSTPTPRTPTTSRATGARRTSQASTGASRRIHRRVRRYQSGEDSQPPSHAEPTGSVTGTSHDIRCDQSSDVPVTRAATAISSHAPAANTHSDGPMRRTRSRTVRHPPRRPADAAKRLPDTKNITGIAASTVTAAAPVACQITTLISAAARSRSSPRSRPTGRVGARVRDVGGRVRHGSGTPAPGPPPPSRGGAAEASRSVTGRDTGRQVAFTTRAGRRSDCVHPARRPGAGLRGPTSPGCARRRRCPGR